MPVFRTSRNARQRFVVWDFFPSERVVFPVENQRRSRFILIFVFVLRANTPSICRMRDDREIRWVCVCVCILCRCNPSPPPNPFGRHTRILATVTFDFHNNVTERNGTAATSFRRNPKQTSLAADRRAFVPKVFRRKTTAPEQWFSQPGAELRVGTKSPSRENEEKKNCILKQTKRQIARKNSYRRRY